VVGALLAAAAPLGGPPGQVLFSKGVGAAAVAADFGEPADGVNSNETGEFGARGGDWVR